MKKRLVFMAMLACVLAFGLVFVGCKSDDGGVSIPSLSGFKTTDFADIGLVVSGYDPVPLASAETVIEPFFKLLYERYDDLYDFINYEIGEPSGSFNYDLSGYAAYPDVTGIGMTNLAGSIKGSVTDSSTLFSYSGTTNFTHDYDSDTDSGSGSFIGTDTIKAKVKGLVKESGSETHTSKSQSQAGALSYAAAFISGTYSGYAIVTVGWAFEGVYLLATDTEKFTSGPTASVKFDLYAPNGTTLIGSQTITGEDAIDMLGLFD